MLCESRFIGSYTVFLPQYYKCSGCGELLLPKEASGIMEAREKELLEDLISNLPVKQFITAAEAAEILGITRQAFHKHQRIKKGFIYSAVIGGMRLYSKKSVQLFKEKKDGRFPLAVSTVKDEVEYVTVLLNSAASSSAGYPQGKDFSVGFDSSRYIFAYNQPTCSVQ
ncbi:hypothetical protein [Candidatus Electronema sp. PJ]|uniref:hypothetical protein n=1 Tax=Candidatus Electronema sp. PJ TaxID=3401572 RepID=UPI003AA91080